MKKSFIYYIVSWMVLVGLFHIVCFVTPDEIGGVSKYAGSFWYGYAFTILAFVIHFLFMWYALQSKNVTRKMVNIPLIYISIIELSVMAVASTACMLIPNVPYWIGILICYGIVAFSILFFLSAKVVGESTTQANTLLNEKVSLFRTMTDEALHLENIAKTKEEKLIVQKVYETIRYSDPMSCEELYDEEMKIQEKLNELTVCISAHEDINEVQKQAEEIINLVRIRNNKCKSRKRKY